MPVNIPGTSIRVYLTPEARQSDLFAPRRTGSGSIAVYSPENGSQRLNVIASCLCHRAQVRGILTTSEHDRKDKGESAHASTPQ
jgi:hypothetical protein